jgi:hypothetical protein
MLSLLMLVYNHFFSKQVPTKFHFFYTVALRDMEREKVQDEGMIEFKQQLMANADGKQCGWLSAMSMWVLDSIVNGWCHWEWWQ